MAFLPQHAVIFSFGYLKLRDLAKLWFLKLIMTKSNLKKTVTSFRGRHRNYVTEKHH